MHTLDERYCNINDLKQGEKFTYKEVKYMSLPEHVLCYDQKCNAINLVTGTMTYFSSNYILDLETMILEQV